MKPQLSLSAAAIRACVLAVAGALFVFIFTQYRHEFSLVSLAARETQFRQAIDAQPVLAYLAAYLIYTLATGLSIPGATVLTLVYGWLFGFWAGLILVSCASTSGATLAFLLSRYLFRDAIQQRFGESLQKFNQSLANEGAFYLFTLRLIPAVPFFVINAVMGLTPLSLGTFWWVSQLGMFPGTVVYVSAGSSVPNLQTLAERGAGGILSPQLGVALVCLGVFPLAVKKAMNWWRPAVSGAPETSDSTPEQSLR